MTTLLLVVACALVDEDGRVLLSQRPPHGNYPGLWEFPGGKMEPGETPEEALVRELDEELGIDVSQACLAPLSFVSYGYPEFHLLMPVFIARRFKGEAHGREGQTLAWVRVRDLASYPLLPADLPLIPVLRDVL